MFSIISYITKSLIVILIRLRMYEMIGFFLSFHIKALPQGKVWSSDEKRLSILALSPSGFRGDLEALNGKSCNIYTLSNDILSNIQHLFYETGLRPRDKLNPEKGTLSYQAKQKLLNFYTEVLPIVYRWKNIDCVITYHIKTPADVDWAIASSRVGIPYIVLYREGLFASAPRLREKMPILFDRFGFWGDHLIVQNESCRALCIESGLVTEDKVSALGSLRMDAFVDRVRTEMISHKTKAAKQITFFPIVFASKANISEELKFSYFDDSLLPYFNEVMVALTRFIEKYPDVRLLIKPKPKDLNRFHEVMEQVECSVRDLVYNSSNVTIDADIHPQDAILQSDIICGINSTTILEAGFANKHVVVPLFSPLCDEPYIQSIKFRDVLDNFSVAHSRVQFMELMEAGLQKISLDNDTVKKRREAFERYVSDPDGQALSKYLQKFDEVISENSSRNAELTRG